ncbi:MAG TPA: tetratricopeptide repeat protein [Thermoanaerobaculia bacterium]
MRTPAERFPRLRELFHELVDLPAGEREARLAGLSPEDGDLAPSLRELLAAADAPEDPIAAALSGAGRELEPDPEAGGLIGRRIGPWEVVRWIGHGGMGRVFLARRADGAFDQEVALKLIRPGFASRQLLQRFRDERQVLASLAHPHIARLLDGGATEDGLPYLVMEHVEGATLEEHCAARGLSLDECVDLFLAVCAAVEHAHRNLVVHRDLKPGNILVTREGEPKLLDFGIAKLLGREAGDATLTQGAATLGTVTFASPEQLRGEAVTTANDVYSLGVILYRLLSGRHPYDLDDVPFPEAVRRVCESEPPPPSRAAAEAGDATAARVLRGDLDNVILLALCKSPAERYPSVAALAADLRAWRAGRPVAARQPTARYRAVKFVRRHRLGVAAAAVTLLSLVGGLGAAAWSARQARAEARRAELERARAEEVSGFLQGLLGATNSSAWGPRQGPYGAKVTVAEVLDAAARRLDRHAGQPAVAAPLRRALGASYAGIGLYAPAERELRLALALHRRVYGERSLETTRVWNDLGGALFLAGKHREAEPVLRRAVALYRGQAARRPAEETSALNALALIRAARGEPEEAERLLEDALALARRGGEEARPMVVLSIANLGQLHHFRGNLAAAETAYREALRLQTAEQRRGWEDAFLKGQLGNVVLLRGDLDEGERLLREAVRGFAGSSGERFRWSVAAHSGLASALWQRGDLAGAEAEARRTLEIMAAAAPSDSAGFVAPRGLVGSILVESGRAAEAEPLLREALAGAERSGNPFLHAAMQSALGECLLALGRRAEAAPLLRDGYRNLLATKGAENPYTRRAAERLARLDRQGAPH